MYFSKYTVLSFDETAKQFDSSKSGLTSKTVEEKIKIFGLNHIDGHELKWWQVFLRQFKSPFIYLLFFAAGLAYFLGEKIDAMMIIGFIFINTVLGFAQEYHSEKSLYLLKKYVVARARVKRDNKENLVDATELVPGDIVMVETGDVVPADLRLMEVENLSIDESVLTGESAPANKKSDKLSIVANEVSKADNLVFSGTTVVSGKGVGVVIATGKNSFIGEVAKLTVETHRESSFEKGITKFSTFILKMILVILVLLFVSNILIKGREANIAELVLFSIALAVSVIPEALPLVTTLSLSRGALRLAKDKVVVKRLSAVEDLGSIEILCTDKTGTITENKMSVAMVEAQDKEKCLFYATAASSFLSDGKAEPNNSFDLALWKNLSKKDQQAIKKLERIHEIPFDPIRRRNDVVVMEEKDCVLIVRGALEEIVGLCKNLNKTEKNKLNKIFEEAGILGQRVLAVAIKKVSLADCQVTKEEKDLDFVGLISFVDPIKPSTKNALSKAEKLGIGIKILTGDAKEVAGAVAHEVGLIDDPELVMTGSGLEKLSEKEQVVMVEKYHVFARVSPQQKFLIIKLLQKKFEVGFLGEGINDAPALKLANVAMVVDGASDIAREASDIVLLNPSLSVIIDGIKNGREIFANTIKYLKITLISNFGNFYAIAIASLIITFLPMLPIQILLLNLLSDFPMIAIATDTVDTIELRRPKSYNVREVVLMAIFLGIVSTVFDFIFFALFYRHEPSVLQTNWFIGSVLTELVLIYSVRTHFFCLKTKAPSKILGGLSVLAILVTILLPFSPFGVSFFRFQTPTFEHLGIILSVVACYFVITEIIKLIYYRMTGFSH